MKHLLLLDVKVNLYDEAVPFDHATEWWFSLSYCYTDRTKMMANLLQPSSIIKQVQ